MKDYDKKYTFLLSDKEEPGEEDVVNILKESGADMFINYFPLGSEKAARFYAECALKAGVGFINCMHVFIPSDPDRGKRGILYFPSAYFMKHPPRQFTDAEEHRMTEDFIGGRRAD